MPSFIIKLRGVTLQMLSSNTGCQKRRRLLMTSQRASRLWEHLRKVWPCGCIPLQEDSMSTEAAQSMREHGKSASFQRQTFADATKHCHSIADLRRWGVAFIGKHPEQTQACLASRCNPAAPSASASERRQAARCYRARASEAADKLLH